MPINKDLILYLGRLDPIKGPDLFITTVLELSNRKNLEAWVVGGEKYTYEKQLLQTQSSALTLDEKIRFFEPIPHQQLPWLYSAADILIVPSYYESFSMVTAESLATGTPVIASDVAGPASLIENGKSGFLIKKRPLGAQSSDFHRFLVAFWHPFFMKFRNRRNLVFCKSLT